MEVLQLAKPVLGFGLTGTTARAGTGQPQGSGMPLSCGSGKVCPSGVGAPEISLFAHGRVWAAQQGPRQQGAAYSFSVSYGLGDRWYPPPQRST